MSKESQEALREYVRIVEERIAAMPEAERFEQRVLLQSAADKRNARDAEKIAELLAIIRDAYEYVLEARAEWADGGLEWQEREDVAKTMRRAMGR